MSTVVTNGHFKYLKKLKSISRSVSEIPTHLERIADALEEIADES